MQKVTALSTKTSAGTPANIDNEKLNTQLAVVNASWDGLSTKVNAATDQQKQSTEFNKEIDKLEKDIQEPVIQKVEKTWPKW